LNLLRKSSREVRSRERESLSSKLHMTKDIIMRKTTHSKLVGWLTARKLLRALYPF
jgi:hypothetical protein